MAVSLGFFDDILIPPADLQDNTVLYVVAAHRAGGRAGTGPLTPLVSRPLLLPVRGGSDTKEQVWVWQYNGHQLYMDVDEEIRFRVQEEIFVDTMPTTASDSGAALAPKPSAEQRHAPYTIHVRRLLALRCGAGVAVH